MSRQERGSTFHLVMIVATLVGISALTYLEEKGLFSSLRGGAPHLQFLYFIPIVWSARIFGLSGGLSCSLGVSSIYFPILATKIMGQYEAKEIYGYLWAIVLFNAAGWSVGDVAQRILYEQRRYQAFYQISEALNSRLSEDELIDLTIDHVERILNVERVALFLKNPRDGALELRKSRGLSIEEKMRYARALAKSERCLALDLLQMQEPVVSNRYEDSRRFSQVMERPPSPLIRNFLAVPLAMKEGPIGLIAVENKKKDDRFTREDLTALSTLANQALKAVENSRLYEMGIKDSLTDLYIRRFYLLQLDADIRRARRYGSALSAAMIDIDLFKQVNDTYGHPQGDVVLKELAQVLKQQVRDSDLVARYGGEEFMLLLPETPLEDARMVAERIRQAVERRPFPGPGQGLRMTVSVGVVEWSDFHHPNKEALVEAADQALLAAKRNGRNRVEVWRREAKPS